MAEAFYNHYTNSDDAFSAGTSDETPLKYPCLPNSIQTIMTEEGIDVSKKKVKTIERHFVDEADRIFVLCEREKCPDYLLNSGKVSFWEIEDPYESSMEFFRMTRDRIKEKVKGII